jgi:3-deoxy-D-manno-octulosonate 8-phosphate phosphatase (KDO 8-P phosphatase)
MIKDIRGVKLLISDVDGVWTDGSIYIGNNQTADPLEIKKFSVLDGVGVAMAKAANINIALISGRYSKATEIRAKELKVKEIFNGSLNKLPVYENLKKKYKLNDSQIAYVGDDLIDVSVMEKVGFPITVSNANERVKQISVYITTKIGGQGAFREAIEWILMKQDRLDEVLSIMDHNVKKM